VLHARHLDVQVDAVEQRPGQTPTVALDHGRGAGAAILGFPQETAETGV
jgi:hypothetical protein